MNTHQSFQFEDVRYFKFGHSPVGKPLMHVYVYYVDGLLIDTGQAGARKRISKTLKDLPVDQIFLTHHHEDHSGNVALLRDQFDCPTYASPACCRLMKNPPKISLAQKLVWKDRPADHKLLPMEGTITTPHHNFQLIPIPGHAEDMVALFEPKQGWLFSADLFIHPQVTYLLHSESILDQIQSISKILDLDFDVLFCCHNPRIKDGREKLQAKLNNLTELFEQVKSLYENGRSEQEIFKTLELKERRLIKWVSGGYLSKINMVKAVIRDIEEHPNKDKAQQ